MERTSMPCCVSSVSASAGRGLIDMNRPASLIHSCNPMASGGRKPPVLAATGGLRPPLATVLLVLLAAVGRADEAQSIVSRQGDAVLEVEADEIVKGVPRSKLSGSVILKLRFVSDRTVEVRDLQIAVDEAVWFK